MTSKVRKVILALETSCDDTAASVCINGKICSNIVSTQEVHQKYGGVIPELASRAHQQNIVPVVEEALKQAEVTKNELTAIAYTQGPGLLGSLLVGSSFAKAMSLSLNVPLIGVNHLQAHVMAHFIDDPVPQFPFICLLVSGGHTQIILVKNYTEMEIIGTTIDDAAGEAFDKAAKIMGLPYPGGPLIDRYSDGGDPRKFDFPDSRVAALNFSFSGIKTAILYFLRDETKKNPNFVEENLSDLCASIQYTIVSYLLRKLKMASKQYNINRIGIAGGVSANRALRSAVLKEEKNSGWEVFVPSFEYCTDNAGMIAMAGHFAYEANDFQNLQALPFARYDF